MCEYCGNIDPNNKYHYKPPERLPIIDTDIDIGDFGKSRLVLYIKDGTMYLAMDNYGVSGKTIRKARSITFCPICGTNICNKGGN